MPYKFLEHTAELKIQATGKTLNQAFEQLAKAISNYMGQGKKISQNKKVKINLSEKNKEALLYNFIEKLISLLDTKNFMTSSAKVKIKDNSLSAEIKGDNSKKYNLNYIKSPTYSEMKIEKNKSGWKIQIVLDV